MQPGPRGAGHDEKRRGGQCQAGQPQEGMRQGPVPELALEHPRERLDPPADPGRGGVDVGQQRAGGKRRAAGHAWTGPEAAGGDADEPGERQVGRGPQPELRIL